MQDLLFLALLSIEGVHHSLSLHFPILVQIVVSIDVSISTICEISSEN